MLLSGDDINLGAGIAQWLPAELVIKESRVRFPAVQAGDISFQGAPFCADSYFGIRSTLVLPQ